MSRHSSASGSRRPGRQFGLDPGDRRSGVAALEPAARPPVHDHRPQPRRGRAGQFLRVLQRPLRPRDVEELPPHLGLAEPRVALDVVQVVARRLLAHGGEPLLRVGDAALFQVAVPLVERRAQLGGDAGRAAEPQLVDGQPEPLRQVGQHLLRRRAAAGLDLRQETPVVARLGQLALGPAAAGAQPPDPRSERFGGGTGHLPTVGHRRGGRGNGHIAASGRPGYGSTKSATRWARRSTLTCSAARKAHSPSSTNAVAPSAKAAPARASAPGTRATRRCATSICPLWINREPAGSRRRRLGPRRGEVGEDESIPDRGGRHRFRRREHELSPRPRGSTEGVPLVIDAGTTGREVATPTT